MVSLLLTLNRFKTCSCVFVVMFQQTNASLALYTNEVLMVILLKDIKMINAQNVSLVLNTYKLQIKDL